MASECEHGNGEERWWLVAQVPAVRPGTAAGIEILRRLTEEEARGAREANAMLKRLAAVTPYARMVELFDELTRAMGSGATAARIAADMNRSAHALGTIARDYPDELRQQAEDLDDTERAELERAISEEIGRTPFRVLAATGGLASGPFAPVGDDGVGYEDRAIAELSAEVLEVTPAIDLVATLRSGLVVALRLVGRQLEIYQPRTAEAAQLLRQLASEVPDGVPGLIRADDLNPTEGKLNLGQITIDPLALNEAIHLHRANQRARELLKQTTDGQAVDENDRPNAEAMPEADAKDETVAAEPTAPDPPEAPEGTPDDQVLDLPALTRHATTLSKELERAWSAALPSVDDPAYADLHARLRSLLVSIHRRIGAADRSLREAGINPQVAAYPPLPETVASFTFDPDDEERWRQLQLALIDALAALVEAVGMMQEPSAQRIDLETGRSESWWEAGAFSLVRSRAQLLSRVVEAASCAEARMCKGEAEEPSSDSLAFDRLLLARGALDRGDPEGALIHTIVAMRVRFGLDHAELVEVLTRLASNLAEAGEEASVLRLLAEAAEALGKGRPLDIGAAVLVAPRAFRTIGRLCLQAPEVVEAARDGDNHGT